MFKFLLSYLVIECRLWYFGKLNTIWGAEMPPDETPVGLFLRRPLIALLSSRNTWDIIEILFVNCVSETFKVTLMCVHVSEWICFSLMKSCVFLDHWHPRVNCLKRCVCVEFLFTWGNTGFRGRGLKQCNVCVSLSSWVSKAPVSTYPDWSVSNVAMEMLRWDEMLILMAVSNVTPAAPQYITSWVDKLTIFLFSSNWVTHNSPFAATQAIYWRQIGLALQLVCVCFDDRW